MYERANVVLLSGGLDSLLIALLADSERQKKWNGKGALTMLTVAYGQGDPEIYAAKRLAARYEWRLVLANVTPLPESLDPAGTNLRPGRNQMFLSLAAAMLPSEGGVIHIGSNADDQADYPDCRPAFFAAFETAQRAQGREIKVWAPLVNLPKSEVVHQLRHRGAPLDMTVSCYQYNGGPCGECSACKLRAKALEAG